jgi:hypothetical protein
MEYPTMSMSKWQLGAWAAGLAAAGAGMFWIVAPSSPTRGTQLAPAPSGSLGVEKADAHASTRPGIAPADFARLHALIKPQKGEALWAEIPWMANLWEARRKAATEGKPLFVWSASADPLGCT